MKSVCVDHASEPFFELCAVKSKPTNSACDFEPLDSYNIHSFKNYWGWVSEWLKNDLKIFESHFDRIVKNHEAQVSVM